MPAPVTQKRLKELLDYDELTGVLTWVKSSPKGRMVQGAIAGTLHANGARYITVDQVIYNSARLVWLHLYGELPIQRVLRINGVVDDTTKVNLTLSTKKQLEKAPQLNAGLLW